MSLPAMIKATFLRAALCAAAIGSAFAGGEGWTDDFEAAKAEAAEKGQSLLMDFTGSDWCGWCIKLNEEVFSKDPFKEGVKDKFVLVELDYPQDQSKLSDETKKQNEKLQEQYAITGFPTIVLADTKGRPFATGGYREGGAEAYVSFLDGQLGKLKARNEAFDKAEKLEGTEKAEALVAALEAMELSDELVAEFYDATVSEIKAADPEDTTGFSAKMEEKKQYAAFEMKLNSLAREGDHEAALKFVDETIEKDEFKGESKQQIAMIKAMILAQLTRFDESLVAFDAAKEINPNSELGERIGSFKERVAQMAEEAKSAGDSTDKPAEEEEAAE